MLFERAPATPGCAGLCVFVGAVGVARVCDFERVGCGLFTPTGTCYQLHTSIPVRDHQVEEATPLPPFRLRLASARITSSHRIAQHRLLSCYTVSPVLSPMTTLELSAVPGHFAVQLKEAVLPFVPLLVGDSLLDANTFCVTLHGRMRSRRRY